MQVIMGNCALVAARECLQSPPVFFTYPLKLPFSASQHPSASLEEDIISAMQLFFLSSVGSSALSPLDSEPDTLSNSKSPLSPLSYCEFVLCLGAGNWKDIPIWKLFHYFCLCLWFDLDFFFPPSSLSLSVFWLTRQNCVSSSRVEERISTTTTVCVHVCVYCVSVCACVRRKQLNQKMTASLSKTKLCLAVLNRSLQEYWTSQNDTDHVWKWISEICFLHFICWNLKIWFWKICIYTRGEVASLFCLKMSAQHAYLVEGLKCCSPSVAM